MSRSASTAGNANRLQTPVESVREIRIGKYLVDRVIRGSGTVSPAFEELVRKQCRQLGYDPETVVAARKDEMLLAVAVRIVPYIRAALRRESRNRETILVDPRDTRLI